MRDRRQDKLGRKVQEFSPVRRKTCIEIISVLSKAR